MGLKLERFERVSITRARVWSPEALDPLPSPAQLLEGGMTKQRLWLIVAVSPMAVSSISPEAAWLL
jgi:hypothetical protein